MPKASTNLPTYQTHCLPNKKMKTPISYYGGKQMLLKYILPKIPIHQLYCEPFFGGGAVFFAKLKSNTEVINDRNGEVINFFRMTQLRFDDLEKEIKSTLHSRELYKKALEIYKSPYKHTELKRAWAFWTLTNQGFASMIGSWGFGRDSSREVAVANKREQFTKVYAERLKVTQIENNDALKVLKRCDTSDTFFYCDPPYINTHQGHYKGYTETDYKELLETLSTIKGKFLLSGYPSEILSKYIKKQGWHCQSIEKKIAVSNRVHKTKTEVLVSNYDPSKMKKLQSKETLAGVKKTLKTSPSDILALKYIKRYVKFHQQKMFIEQLHSFFEEIQMSIKNQDLLPDSKYANELNLIQSKIAKFVNIHSAHKNTIFKIQINTKDLNNLTKSLLNESESIFVHKARKAILGLGTSTSVGVILAGIKAETGKKSVIKKEDKSDNFEIESTKILASKSKIKESIIKKSTTEKPKIEKGMDGIFSASEIGSMQHDVLAFSGKWKSIFGNPGKNFDLMLHGGPQKGKTTFLLEMAGYLAKNHGKVLYISSEEFGSATLTNKVKELLPEASSDLHFKKNLENINLHDYQFLILDSINHLGLTLKEYKELREKYPKIACIIILQHTKDGQFRGGKDWEHEVDIAAEIVELGKINVYKNRYNVIGEHQFLDVSKLGIAPQGQLEVSQAEV